MRWEIERCADYVEFATEECRDQRVDDAGAQLDLHLWLLAAKSCNDRWQDTHRPDWAGTDIDGAARAAFDRLNLGNRVPVFELHQPCAPRQDFAEAGRDDPGRQPFE